MKILADSECISTADISDAAVDSTAGTPEIVT